MAARGLKYRKMPNASWILFFILKPELLYPRKQLDSGRPFFRVQLTTFA